MKILHVIQRYWPYTGGSERHFQEISERLARRGHQVTVLTTDALDLQLFWNPTKERATVSSEIHNDVAIRRLRVRHLPGRHLTFGAIRRAMLLLASLPVDTGPILRRLASYVPWVPDIKPVVAALDADYDVFHGMNICFESLLLPTLAEARRRKIPFLITPLIHLGESPTSLVRRIYTMPHQIQLLREADRILAQTTIERDYLLEHGVAPAQLTVAGVGVNPPEVLGGDGNRFRNAYNVGRPFVAYVGTAAYDKGTLHLVKGMRRLWESGRWTGEATAVDLVLAGPVLDSFRSYLGTLPATIQSRVHVLGFIPESSKRDLLDAASLLAMPSRTDSFGIVYLEAWLYGKPVIGARAGGVPAVIDDGSDGYLVEFGDVGTLAERIAALLAEPELGRRMGERGREKTLGRYTWDRIYPSVEEVYEELCPPAKVKRPVQ